MGDRQSTSTSTPATLGDRSFTFDGVLGWRASQEQVFKGESLFCRLVCTLEVGLLVATVAS
jgi:hypothetical protein